MSAHDGAGAVAAESARPMSAASSSPPSWCPTFLRVDSCAYSIKGNPQTIFDQAMPGGCFSSSGEHFRGITPTLPHSFPFGNLQTPYSPFLPLRISSFPPFFSQLTDAGFARPVLFLAGLSGDGLLAGASVVGGVGSWAREGRALMRRIEEIPGAECKKTMCETSSGLLVVSSPPRQYHATRIALCVSAMDLSV